MTVQYTTTLQLQVPAQRAWGVLVDVRRWPDWTPTVTAVDAPAELQTGQNITITQPGRRPVLYNVERLEFGRQFRWGSNRGGVRQWANHLITPDGEQACIVELTFAMTGLLGAVLGRLGASKIRAMVDAEAAALTAHLVGPLT